MPELPEVETTRRGIEPHLERCSVASVLVREHRLRWPVPVDLAATLYGLTVEAVERRGKYLLIRFSKGTLIVHLGMSGSLRIVPIDAPIGKHDHVDIVFDSGFILRYTDPRRFGSVLWTGQAVEEHKLLKSLGPEPLSSEFDGAFLHQLARKRSGPVKSFIMDSHIVVGVGNIYANEALFRAAIHPKRSAGRISLDRYLVLAQSIKDILAEAIRQGGTTLRDFVGGDGKPGYFKQELSVYGRGGLPCMVCEQILKEVKLGQRSTVYCKVCQR